MNLFFFQRLYLVAFLARTARSFALPAQRVGPPSPEKRPCYSRFRDMTTWSLGTCQEPNDSYQCEDGITTNTRDCGSREDGRQINCCIHLPCNSRLSGTCQNSQFKTCNGEWTVSLVFFFSFFLFLLLLISSFRHLIINLFESSHLSPTYIDPLRFVDVICMRMREK